MPVATRRSHGNAFSAADGHALRSTIKSRRDNSINNNLSIAIYPSGSGCKLSVPLCSASYHAQCLSSDHDDLQSVVVHPSNWICECGNTGELWLCLYCARVHCANHVFDHCKIYLHSCAVELNSCKCQCLTCKMDLLSSESLNDSLKDHAIIPLTQSGNGIRRSSRKKSKIQSESLFHSNYLNDSHGNDASILDIAFLRGVVTGLREMQTLSMASCESPLGRHLWQKLRNVLKWTLLNPKRSRDQEKLDSQAVADHHRRFKILSLIFSKWAEPIRRKNNIHDNELNIDGLDKVQPMSFQPSHDIVFIPGRVGLRNIGNTCFINSVIQALSNVSVFRKLFKDSLKATIEQRGGLLIRVITSHASPSPTHPAQTTILRPSPSPGICTPRSLDSRFALSNDRSRPSLEPFRMERMTTSQCLDDLITNSTPLICKSSKKLMTLSPQSLRKNKNFHNYNNSVSMPRSLVREYHRLIRTLWSGKVSVVTPNAFVSCLWIVCPQFKGFCQHDAHDLFSAVMDVFQTELDQPVAPTDDAALPTKYVNENGDASVMSLDPFSSIRAGSLHNKLEGKTENVNCDRDPQYLSRAPVSSEFSGMLISRVRCLKCFSERGTRELFWSITLDIPFRCWAESNVSLLRRTRSTTRSECDDKDVIKESATVVTPTVQCTLTECLSDYFQLAALNGDNRYDCEKCHMLTDANKGYVLDRLPNMLVFHLNRVNPLAAASGFPKIQCHVSFPLSGLSIAEFSSNDPDSVSDRVSCICGNKCMYTYDLRAVVVHEGRSTSMGHYLTYAFNDTASCWMRCNDQVIVPVSEVDVQAIQAYLLFYERRKCSQILSRKSGLS